MKKKNYRIEKDSMGSIQVPQNAYWGAQTQRSLLHFAIGTEKIPLQLIYALAQLKKACALANCEYGLLSKETAQAIAQAADEVVNAKHDCEFPLSVWQTGSGTQTNMNMNEVLANRSSKLLGRQVHPNDHVNLSQSSNDIFPSAIHLATYLSITNTLIPSLQKLERSLTKKAKAFKNIVKVGRTHLMDAAPITLGQEFSGYAALLQNMHVHLKYASKQLLEIGLGATAVGTGLNAPKGFGKTACKQLKAITGVAFKPAKNYFAELSSSQTSSLISSLLKMIAESLYKIANDIRWMGSGPRCGLSELILPANEPGSSIMPGKVNPTQCEALLMVCIQCFGLESAVSIASSQGNFELNVCRPLIAYNILISITLLSDSMDHFRSFCIDGLTPNKTRLAAYLDSSLMLATALTPHVGYDMATKIVQKAHVDQISVKKAALQLTSLSSHELDTLLDPARMIRP